MKIFTPKEIKQIQEFGQGIFSEEDVKRKSEVIRNKMEKRKGLGKDPEVSIIVPAHKEEKYILSTLFSLSNQTLEDCEFIIVNNDDEIKNKTREIIEKSGFSIVDEPRVGVSWARKKGLENAKGKVIITTDADTIHNPEWAEKIAEYFGKHNIIAGSGKYHFLSDKWKTKLYKEFDNFSQKVRWKIDPALVLNVSEANSFFKKDAALAVEGYDTNKIQNEGMTLFKKIKNQGGEVLFIPKEDIAVFTSGRRMDKESVLKKIIGGTIDIIKKETKERPFPVVRSIL